MEKYKTQIAVLLVVVIFCGLLEACAYRTAVEGDEKAEILAEVKAIAEDGTLELYIYAQKESASEYEIADYASIEWDNFAYAFDTMEYTIPKDAVVQSAEDGLLTDINPTNIAKGDKVLIYTNEIKSEGIVVYHCNNYRRIRSQSTFPESNKWIILRE